MNIFGSSQLDCENELKGGCELRLETWWLNNVSVHCLFVCLLYIHCLATIHSSGHTDTVLLRFLTLCFLSRSGIKKVVQLLTQLKDYVKAEAVSAEHGLLQ